MLFGIAEIIVNPLGDFPLNDDWWYAHFYKKLFEEYTLPKLTWPAAGIWGQLLLTKPFAILFGSSSISLRFFTLLLSAFTLLFFYKICTKHLKLKNETGFVLTLLLLFNPLFFNLSNSYMTDTPFMFMLLGAFYFYLNFKETKKYFWFILSLLFFCLGILTRQMIVAFILGIAITEIIISKKIVWRNIILTIIPALALLLFELWMKYQVKSISYTYIILRNSVMMNEIPIVESFIYFGKRWVHYISLSGFAFFPLIIPFLINYFKNLKENNSIKILLFSCVIYVPVFISLLNFPLGNYIFDCGIGYNTLYDALIPNKGPYQFSSNLTFTVIKLLAFVGAFGYLLACLSFLSKFLSKNLFANLKANNFTTQIIISLMLYYGFLTFTGSLFDRYTLPFTFFSLFVLQKEFLFSSPKLKFIYLLIIPLLMYAVLGTKDYLNENRAKWEAVNLLKNNFAATDIDINAGYEHEGSCFADSGFWLQKWYNTNPNLYLVTRKKHKNYKPLGVIVFQRYMPLKKDSIFYSKLNP